MSEYNEQVDLLLHCMPTVANIESFVLKGGTAINLFVQPDFPRLSVDIDLIYLPLQDRSRSLSEIEAGLRQIEQRLSQTLDAVSVKLLKNNQTKTITRLTVSRNGVEIKIEPNLVLRGTVYPPTRRDLNPAVAAQYGLNVYNVPVAAKADLYGGKICAALDRQHPRDLFDIKILLEEEGISEEIKKAFLVYLASHNRPMHELLQPNRLDLVQSYEEEFLGMSMREVSLKDLVEVREALIETIHKILTEQDKAFLIGIKSGMVQGELIDLPMITTLPGIQWKLINIGKMEKTAQQQAVKKLEAVLTR